RPVHPPRSVRSRGGRTGTHPPRDRRRDALDLPDLVRHRTYRQARHRRIGNRDQRRVGGHAVLRVGEPRHRRVRRPQPLRPDPPAAPAPGLRRRQACLRGNLLRVQREPHRSRRTARDHPQSRPGHLRGRRVLGPGFPRPADPALPVGDLTMSYTLIAGTGVAPCEPGRTVLEAFLRNGNWMPNSCNQGTCGTCKIKVLDGELDHRNSPEETLTADELAAGFVLACQATPRGDVVFETPATEESAGTHVLRDVVATVAEVRDIATDTRKVLLTADEPLEFSAGQYVEVTVPGTEIRRQYSLANP